MSTLSIQEIRACNASNVIYIKTVNPKKVLDAENQGIPTITIQSFHPSNPTYVDTVIASCKISNAFNAKIYWQCQHYKRVKSPHSQLSKTSNRLKIH